MAEQAGALVHGIHVGVRASGSTPVEIGDRAVHAGADPHELRLVLAGDSGEVTVRLSRERPFTARERALVGRLAARISEVSVGGPTGDLLARTLEESLALLDGLVHATTLERLVAVAAHCQRATGVRRWWVGEVDGDRVHAVLHDDAARLRGGPVPMRTVPLSSIDVAPEIATALRGGSFAGPVPDTPWRATYEALGLRDVVGAGGWDDDARQWLLVLADDGTVDVHRLRVLVSAVTHAALGAPLPRRG